MSCGSAAGAKHSVGRVAPCATLRKCSVLTLLTFLVLPSRNPIVLWRKQLLEALRDCGAKLLCTRRGWWAAKSPRPKPTSRCGGYAQQRIRSSKGCLSDSLINAHSVLQSCGSVDPRYTTETFSQCHCTTIKRLPQWVLEVTSSRIDHVGCGHEVEWGGGGGGKGGGRREVATTFRRRLFNDFCIL